MNDTSRMEGSISRTGSEEEERFPPVEEDGCTSSGVGPKPEELPEPVTFWVQSNALLRKNLTYQRRNWATNLCLVLTPLIFSVLLYVIQMVVDNAFEQDDFKCGCQCTNYCLTYDRSVCFSLEQYGTDGMWPPFIVYDGQEIAMVPSNDDLVCTSRNNTQCGLVYSTSRQAAFCSVENPTLYPSLFQVPNATYRAQIGETACNPDEVKNGTEDCPAGLLFTGADRALATILGVGLTNTARVVRNLVDNAASNSTSLFGEENLQSNPFEYPAIFRNETEAVLGTPEIPDRGLMLDSAYRTTSPVYYLLEDCLAVPEVIRDNLTSSSTLLLGQPLLCVNAPALWENTVPDILGLLYAGYGKGAIDGGEAPPGSGQWTGAWDFLSSSSDGSSFEVNVFYNKTISRDTDEGEDRQPPRLLRLAGTLNAASYSYLREVNNRTMLLSGLRDMPKPETTVDLDIGALLGPIFYSWLMQLLLPVMVNLLVYEKQSKIRVMMRMQGLGNPAYWMINFAYFVALYILYLLMVFIFAYALQLSIITNNSFSVTLVFLLLYGIFQVIFAFFLSTLFRSARTATITIVVYLLCGGLLGEFLLKPYIESETIPEAAVIVLIQIPAFALYRGFYELSQYAFIDTYTGTGGLTWGEAPFLDFGFLLVIFVYEGILFMLLALYLERVYDTGLGRKDHPLFFLQSCRKKSVPMDAHPEDGHIVSIASDGPDVRAERERADNIRDFTSNVLVARSLTKTYPAVDGAPPKTACKDLSFAISSNECFGFLGPNGAGKTTGINLMTGLTPPTAGTAILGGLNIRADINRIYSIIGVCPQHDLLWENLTGREHLRFYGRLKNLKGKALEYACKKALQDVNLLRNGVGDRVVGSYSGGMKRRLSVAISLIGNPRIVFLDEPSTGLDPASRRQLWKVIRESQKTAGIILTTHSMEEAEELCGRIGIVVDGRLTVIGNPKELTSRFGGYLILSLMTLPERANEVASYITHHYESAQCTYSIAGFQKWELATDVVSIADIFGLVEEIKKAGIELLDWAVANMTLEEVFIRICKDQGLKPESIANA